MNEPTITLPEGRGVDFPRLLSDLRALNVGIDSIGGRGKELIAYDADGRPMAWPAEAQAVVDAHAPPEPETPPAAILRLLLEDVSDVDETKPILDAMLILLGG